MAGSSIPQSTARDPVDSPLPWLWLALLGLAVTLYFFGLGSFYAPTNGDEMVYIHIARLTADSGHWLPLASDLDHMRNTKPPLLFWQALVAGDWAATGPCLRCVCPVWSTRCLQQAPWLGSPGNCAAVGAPACWRR